MTSSFLDKKLPKSLIQQGLEGSTTLGKDEVGGSNPPSSSIETLESQRIQGFSIFWKFVGKPHFRVHPRICVNLHDGVE